MIEDEKINPSALAAVRRQALLDMTATEFKLWQHNPVTAAYLQFQADLIDDWRRLAADLLEAGAFHLHDPHEDKNPDVVRGRILAVRNLHQIKLEDIQGFYGKEPPVSEDEPAQSQDD